MNAYENRLDAIVISAWEIRTKNGLRLDVEDRQLTMQSCYDAANNAYAEQSDDDWLAETLRRLGHVESPVAMIQWGPADWYWNGYEIGSEDEDGSHMRSTEGWPYSIYRKARCPGFTDVVLCHGIQCMDDAVALNDLLNKDWNVRHGGIG